MSTAWTFDGEIASLGGPEETVTLVEETTFCVSDRAGDMHPGAPHGLIFLDTRFLSTMALRVDGRAVEPLGHAIPDPFRGTFVGRMLLPDRDTEHQLLVRRDRRIGRGLVEVITIENHGLESAHFVLELRVTSDFADVFEVKEQRSTASRVTQVTTDQSRIRLRGQKGNVQTTAMIEAGGTCETHLAAGGPTFSWEVELASQATFSDCIEVTAVIDGAPIRPRHRCRASADESGPARRMGSWRMSVPAVQATDDRLEVAIARGVEDLGALRLVDPDHPEDTVVAAGAPWFMTLFGRDALLASYMALPVDPSLALGTLRTLARLQGTIEDPETEEQPGRIMHEIRFSRRPSWRFQDGDRYFGSVDATPLFLVVLGELRRWGQAGAEVDALMPAADDALAWIERYGDLDGDGFVEYQRTSRQGLANQGWKDSWDAIRFADGRFAEPPIALAEVQGYVFSALLARAHFADEAGDGALRDRLRNRAAALKRAFNEQFFVEEAGTFAMALDRDKRPVDALTSNMGHCLWSGIVEPELAHHIADRLLSDEMFSGWGVRTMATSAAAFDPISYHNGSVWPHDNALIVAGLVRYGFEDHARRVVDGLLDVSTHYGGRLPELLAGISRDQLSVPAIYPTSCLPQAWAAAAPILLLRSMLRLDPWATHDQLWVAPMLAEREELDIDRVPYAGTRIGIGAVGARADIRGLPSHHSVHHEPRTP